METTTARSIHPLTAIAAVSVTLFSLAGIGAMTGIIPTSHGQSALQVLPVKAAEEPAKPVAAAADPALTEKIIAHKSAPKAVKIAHQAAPSAPLPAEEPVKVAKYEPKNEPVVKHEASMEVAQNAPDPRAEPARPACYDCGVIESVREVEKPGSGSNVVGTIAGGALGGILGHQTGAGRGKDVMTVLGAIGGAVAGNAVEKHVRKAKSYEITIRFDDGSTQLIKQDAQPAWHNGDKVKLVNGVITSNS
jgi:outer membrane lipoprotein SlyB